MSVTNFTKAYYLLYVIGEKGLYTKYPSGLDQWPKLKIKGVNLVAMVKLFLQSFTNQRFFFFSSYRLENYFK